MFGFIELSVTNANPLNYVSMSDQECNLRPAIMTININERLFYPYSVLVNKYFGNWNDINNPNAKLCILD